MGAEQVFKLAYSLLDRASDKPDISVRAVGDNFVVSLWDGDSLLVEVTGPVVLSVLGQACDQLAESLVSRAVADIETVKEYKEKKP
jgi:transketolase C-terminal domain/subunit